MLVFFTNYITTRVVAIPCEMVWWFIAFQRGKRAGGIPNLYRLLSTTKRGKSILSGCKVPQFDGYLGLNISHELRQTAWTAFVGVLSNSVCACLARSCGQHQHVCNICMKVCNAKKTTFLFYLSCDD